jgi:hypothetical protein
VPISTFQIFVAALEHEPVSITAQNSGDLLCLCAEFGFESLSARVANFMETTAMRARVESLEEAERSHERQILTMEMELTRPAQSDTALLVSLRTLRERLSGLERAIRPWEQLKEMKPAAEVEALWRSRAAGIVGSDGMKREPKSANFVQPINVVDAPAEPQFEFPFVLDSLITTALPFGFVPRDDSPSHLTVGMIGPLAGKTSFLRRLITNDFRDSLSATIAPERSQFKYHQTHYDVWDTSSGQDYRAFAYRLRDLRGFFLFFNITSQQSFAELSGFLTLIEPFDRRAPVLLVGTHADLADTREIPSQEARKFALDRGWGYAEISSRTGEGVKEAFAQMHWMICSLQESFRYLVVRLVPLWRGSRDGFSAQEFHRHCDRAAPTLTLVRDTNGNIFGGFAVPQWESPRSSRTKPDPTSGSFLFTLRNPHHLEAQTFKLIPGRESSAITVFSQACSCFGEDDLVLSDGCNTNPSHSHGLGSTYANPTSIPGPFVFAGADTFLVDEIEVFEVKRHSEPYTVPLVPSVLPFWARH